MRANLDELDRNDTQVVSDIMESHGFDELKNTQIQAFNDDILSKNNHLLVADTGNGKTLCAESVAKKRLENGGRVAYLVPSTQLVNGKEESIKEWIPDRFTVATGRGKYRTGDIVVATFSSFYQAILRGAGDVRSFDLAILDDFHELYGSFIGPGLEKSIAATKQYDIEIFAMSATIGNPDEIASWLDADLTVSSEDRGIPIIEETVPVSRSKKQSLVEFVDQLPEDKKPVLVFNYAKSWAESRASGIADQETFESPSIDVQEEIRKRVDGSLPESLNELANMIENGVAYHHSSLPRSVREWVESLFKRQEIKCLCATTTIAYGFNSPVKTVVVADMKRQGQWIGKWEFQQWVGRSARPGYGYTEGYAYVLTNNQQTVREEFFKPRQLERITTHIESPQEFRKLILELIVMGWETPSEIESFIQETLYWSQLSTDGAWGKSFQTQEKRLERKLRETADWLERRGFIKENRTQRQFESTDLGEESIEFIFETFITTTLSDIYEFHRWADETSETSRLELLARTCDIFDLGLRQKQSSSDVESALRNEGLDVNGDTITASILHNYWIENSSLNNIEEATGADATYLESKTYRIGTTLKSTRRIIDVSLLRTPDWLDKYSYRVQRGIKEDELTYVKEIRGLGRSRVKQLRQYIDSHTGSLYGDIDKEIDEKGSDEFINQISDNISGVGDQIASRIVSYHRPNK